MMQIIKIAIACIILTSCASNTPALKNPFNIETIGIISIIGNEVEIYRYELEDLTLSSHDTNWTQQDIGWETNKAGDTITQNLFRKYGDINVIPLKYDYSKIYGMYQSNPHTYEVSAEGYEDYIHALVKDTDIDTLLIVSKCDCRDPISETNKDMLSGFGVYSAVWPGNETKYATYAALRVTLLNARNFKIIASEIATHFIDDKNPDFWSKNLLSLKYEKQKQLRNQLLIQINTVISQSLIKWKLIRPVKVESNLKN